MALRELILIRHALPERVEDVDGIADPGLTDVGHQQAERMAQWLASESIDHIVVSPKRRARETAAPLERVTGLIAEVVAELSEIDRAASSYVPIEHVVRENGDRWKAMVEQDWRKLGFHDPDEFRAEVAGATDELIDRTGEGTLAVVAHGGTINVMVTHLMGWPDPFFFPPGYTSITRMIPSLIDGRLRIASVNETGHLVAVRGTHDALPEP